jgi:hypothetical protein
VRRGLDGADSEPALVRAMIDAHEQLQRGRPYEARAIIERVLYPKWDGVRECEQAYKAAK